MRLRMHPPTVTVDGRGDPVTEDLGEPAVPLLVSRDTIMDPLTLATGP